MKNTAITSAFHAQIICISRLPNWVERHGKTGIATAIRLFLDRYRISGLISEEQAFDILNEFYIHPNQKENSHDEISL